MRAAVRLVVVGMCVMMAAAGALSLANLDDSKSVVTDVIVSCYVLLFASVLFLHEVNEIRQIEVVEHILRKNFGFLFKPLGKGGFIVFIAFLNFGLTDSAALGLATGICLCVVGFGYIGLYLHRPEFFESNKPQGAYAPAPTSMP